MFDTRIMLSWYQLKKNISSCVIFTGFFIFRSNFIKTKIRNFVQTLERTSGCDITPYPKCLESEGKSYYAIGIDVRRNGLERQSINMAVAVKQFIDLVYNQLD